MSSNNSIRVFFTLFCILLMTAFTVITTGDVSAKNLVNGLFLGSIASLLLLGMDALFRKLPIRTLNTISLGLFFGFLLGQGMLLVLAYVLAMVPVALDNTLYTFVRVSILTMSCYLGTITMCRTSESLTTCIPFIKFEKRVEQKRNILLDPSLLADTRLIDLASSGLLDQHLIIPRFGVHEIQALIDSGVDAANNSKARRSLEVLKKLEALSHLQLSYSDVDFPDIKDPTARLIKLAKVSNGNIITSDLSRIERQDLGNVRVISVQSLSAALRPITQMGEIISIKVQRYGKEAQQGVGYLDDGTMVVINGGADFIGTAIKGQVLSVKHTSSGRMIFCNALEGTMGEGPSDHYQPEENGHTSSYASV